MKFSFSGELWAWASTTTWYFITLPKDESAEIKFFSNPMRKGFGSVRVDVRIGETAWKTSIFPSKEADAYLLPVKAEIRKANKLKPGDSADVHIEIALD